MLRNFISAAALTALAAGTALASDVAAVNVTADVAAISNERAASYWGNIAPDLQGAILARLVDRLSDDGVTITVDLREVALASAFERAFQIEDAVLVGQVNVSHPVDNSLFDSYELSLSLEGGQTVDALQQTIVVTGIDTPEAYETLINRFADGVIDRLK